MALSKAALFEIIDNAVAGRGTAGIAVISRARARPEAVWLPASASEEPAYLAYSITKPFTAVLLLQLRDEQRLALDDRLSRWLPGIAGSDRMSLRQLLNHTAGIPTMAGSIRTTTRYALYPRRRGHSSDSRPRRSTKDCASIRDRAGRTRTPATCCSGESPKT